MRTAAPLASLHHVPSSPLSVLTRIVLHVPIDAYNAQALGARGEAHAARRGGDVYRRVVIALVVGGEGEGCAADGGGGEVGVGVVRWEGRGVGEGGGQDREEEEGEGEHFESVLAGVCVGLGWSVSRVSMSKVSRVLRM